MDTKFLPVPIVRQSKNYSCGAAALLAVLYYWQAFDGSETDIQNFCGTNKTDGTHPAEMGVCARRYKLKAQVDTNYSIEALKTDLRNGKTVIVNFQAWAKKETDYIDNWNDGHYAVLVGMDTAYIYLMDPSIGVSYGKLTISDFENRWHDLDNLDREIHRLAIVISGTTPIKVPIEPKIIK